ncbi:MAG TPA: slipin family protein [Kofleriaceae bacterium]|jgi:regulator of protease activity HflC (stomatin/prohibitin superfamily)|nr:slipin family protein [Kofleriaceae bacterium]
MSDQDPQAPFRRAETHKLGLNVISAIVFAVFAGSGAALAWQLHLEGERLYGALGASGAIALYMAFTPRIASQWETAVILRLGKYVGLRGPGLFWLLPLVERPVMWIDRRVRTTGFAAEKTLTADTVPVDVDAVLFWTVTDPEKAALAVEDFEEAVAWAAQTALRDVIGKTELAAMLVGRETLDHEMQQLIGERTGTWGIAVHSVEIRDVMIPQSLEDAMSRRAQAERERQARIILSGAEVEIAEKFSIAAERYRNDPIALQLRSMNLLYEGMKERGSIMVVPSAMADAAGAGTYAGLAALGGVGTPLLPTSPDGRNGKVVP